MSQPTEPAAEFNNNVNSSDMNRNASSVFDYHYKPNTSYGGIIISVMSAIGKLFPLLLKEKLPILVKDANERFLVFSFLNLTLLLIVLHLQLWYWHQCRF